MSQSKLARFKKFCWRARRACGIEATVVPGHGILTIRFPEPMAKGSDLSIHVQSRAHGDAYPSFDAQLRHVTPCKYE